ncbi:MAG: hypothetical protein ACRC7O_07490 [Fimbriiglobus sp.]
MTTREDDDPDEGVPERAVQALTEAQRRAMAAGHPVVLVLDGKLIRRVGDQVTVLKLVRGRRKVAVRAMRCGP